METVTFGCWPADVLRAHGGWDERFVRNQDFELNRRMGRTGTVWFDAELEVQYVPRSDLRALFRQYRRFGGSPLRRSCVNTGTTGVSRRSRS